MTTVIAGPGVFNNGVASLPFAVPFVGPGGARGSFGSMAMGGEMAGMSGMGSLPFGGLNGMLEEGGGRSHDRSGRRKRQSYLRDGQVTVSILSVPRCVESARACNCIATMHMQL